MSNHKLDRIGKAVSIWVIAFNFLILAGCSEDPKLTVSAPPPDEKGVEAVTGGQTIVLRSLVYRGREPQTGRVCTVFLSAFDTDSGLQVVARPELLVHGVSPLDMKLDFYLYKLTENQYFSADSAQPGTALALAAARLSNSQAAGEMNQLAQYEADFTLLQSIRIDFRATELRTFQEALQRSLANPQLVVGLYDSLNKISRLQIRIKHLDHYDPTLCLNYQLDRDLQLIEYTL